MMNKSHSHAKEQRQYYLVCLTTNGNTDDAHMYVHSDDKAYKWNFILSKENEKLANMWNKHKKTKLLLSESVPEFLSPKEKVFSLQ